MPIKETPGGLGNAGYISGRAVEREQAQMARAALRIQAGGRVARLNHCARRGDSLTGIQASDSTAARVHLGFDHGTYDSYPLCGALAYASVETTDRVANCEPCARAVRSLDLRHLIRDENGWTGLWEPRRR